MPFYCLKIKLLVAHLIGEFSSCFGEFSATEFDAQLPKLLRDPFCPFQDLVRIAKVNAPRKRKSDLMQCRRSGNNDRFNFCLFRIIAHPFTNPLGMSLGFLHVPLGSVDRPFSFRFWLGTLMRVTGERPNNIRCPLFGSTNRCRTERQPGAPVLHGMRRAPDLSEGSSFVQFSVQIPDQPIPNLSSNPTAIRH